MGEICSFLGLVRYNRKFIEELVCYLRQPKIKPILLKTYVVVKLCKKIKNVISTVWL